MRSVPPNRFQRWLTRHQTGVRIGLVGYLAASLTLLVIAAATHLPMQIFAGSTNIVTGCFLFYTATIAAPRYVRQWDAAQDETPE